MAVHVYRERTCAFVSAQQLVQSAKMRVVYAEKSGNLASVSVRSVRMLWLF